MPRYDVYIPFTCSYDGEIAEEEFSIIVKAENDKDAIQEAIKEAGFEPQLRNQQYEWRELPEQIEEQVINY